MKTKRLLSLALSIVMIFSLLPHAFAMDDIAALYAQQLEEARKQADAVQAQAADLMEGYNHAVSEAISIVDELQKAGHANPLECEHKHQKTETQEILAPTCTTPGSHLEVTSCEDCTLVLSQEIVEDPAAHDYIGEETVPATETEEGEMTYTCSRCGDTYTEPIPALNEEEEDGEEETEEETEEEAVAGEEEPVPFDQSKTVSGVTVRVSAPAGVFPANSELLVDAVPDEEVEPVLEGERKEDEEVVSSYTFDIRVVDENGDEVQPKDAQSVTVSFTLAEAADDTLETNIYHISEGDGGALEAEKLATTGSGSTVTAETGSFSLYRVETVRAASSEPTRGEPAHVSTLEQLQAALNADGTEIVLDANIDIWGEVTLDLKGKNISCPATGVIIMDKLTLVDSVGGGEVNYLAFQESDSTLDIYGGKVVSLVVNKSPVNINIYGGSIVRWYTSDNIVTINYGVTCAVAQNGTVTASINGNPADAAAEDATVTLRVTPADGYALDTLTVTDANNNPVTVNNNSFTMPSAPVTVTAVFKSTVTSYNLWVGGVEVTSANANNITGDGISGKVSYVRNTSDTGGTLTLTNAVIFGDIFGESSLKELTIENSTAEVSAQIVINGTLIIKNSSVTSGGLHSSNSLTIENSRVAASKNSYTISTGSLTIKNSYVNAMSSSDQPAIQADSFEITDSAIVRPEGGFFGSPYIVDKYGNPANEVIIEPTQITPLTITAKDQTYPYNGNQQGVGDTVYAESEKISSLVDVEGLQGNDNLYSVVLFGHRAEVGVYQGEIAPSNAVIKDSNGNVKTLNYTISYVSGTLTITPNVTWVAEPDSGGTVEVVFLDNNKEYPAGANAGENIRVKAVAGNGYKFSEWTSDDVTLSNPSGEEATFTVPAVANPSGEGSLAGKVHVTAKFTPVDYTITFDTDGGDTIPDKVYTVESTEILPTPTKTGFFFGGWKVTSAGGSWTADTVFQAGEPLNGKYGNVTLKAQWSANGLSVADIPSQTYTGSAVTPALTVTDAVTSAVLTTDDYNVSYLQNGKNVVELKNAGEYVVSVAGKGHYAGQTAETTFKINQAANPAKFENAVVTVKNTLDLSDKVSDAEGGVSYAITNAPEGCSVDAVTGNFTSGEKVGECTVTVTVAGNENYLGTTGKIKVTVTDKKTGTLAVKQEGTTYGQPLPDPVFDAPAGSTVTVSYSGSGYGPTAEKPAKAGEYTVTVTAETADTIFTGTADFTIRKAESKITIKVHSDDEVALTSTLVSINPEEAVKALLTEEEWEEYESGADVIIQLDAKELEAAAVPAEDRTVLTARADAAGARVGEWIDISLEKKVGSSPSVEIHQTGTLIYFTVEVPQDLRNTSPLVERTFYLYRAHEGTVTEIASTTGTVLQGSSNLFSTYLLAYKDKAVGGGDYYSTGERYTAVPPSNNPRTGDDSHLALWGALACLSAAGAVLMAKKRKRREH